MDPHGDPALEGAYEIHTLYLDTSALDVYHRAESFRQEKFRARRYGRAKNVHLEQKTRTGDRVSKRRSPVDESTLAGLAKAAGSADLEWGWFHNRVLDRRLIPIARVSYLRSAFVGNTAEGAIRLTLDDHLEADRAASWDVTPASGGIPLLTDQQVLELKFQSALPVLFKELMTRFALSPLSFSKYRLAVGGLGLAKGPD